MAYAYTACDCCMTQINAVALSQALTADSAPWMTLASTLSTLLVTLTGPLQALSTVLVTLTGPPHGRHAVSAQGTHQVLFNIFRFWLFLSPSAGNTLFLMLHLSSGASLQNSYKGLLQYANF